MYKITIYSHYLLRRIGEINSDATPDVLIPFTYKGKKHKVTTIFYYKPNHYQITIK